MSIALARALVLTEVVPWAPVAQALFVSVTKNIPFTQALVQTSALSEDRLEDELARVDAPTVDELTPDAALIDLLPRGLCGRFLAVPLRKTSNGAIEVALADTRDEHALGELRHHLKADVRVVRASYRALQDAVRSLPQPKREESLMESTLVSVRAPEGIQLPPSEPHVRNVPPLVPRRAPSAPPPAHVSTSPNSGSSPPLPLVRRASEQQPIPLVRRAEEPVLELRSPFSRPARPVIESASVAAMRTAGDRHEVLRLLLEGAMESARRVIIFAVRRDGFTGLLCTPTMGDEARIKELRIPLEGPSIFATVASGGTYLGPIYGVDAHKPLLAILPNAADTVALAAVRLRGRPLVLVLAEGMEKPVHDVRHVEEMARAAGEAFARILSAKGE